MKTQEEIRAYTKNCLKLLGYECVTPTDKDFRLYKGVNSVIPEMVDANFDNRFLNDWNWIHEVVEAIEKLEDEQGRKWVVDIYKNCCAITHEWYSTYNICINSETKKEATVEAINQFLILLENNLVNIK